MKYTHIIGAVGFLKIFSSVCTMQKLPGQSQQLFLGQRVTGPPLVFSLTFSFFPWYVLSQNSELKEDSEKNVTSPLSEPRSSKDPYAEPKHDSDIKENQEKDKQGDLKNETKVRSAAKVRRVTPIEGC